MVRAFRLCGSQAQPSFGVVLDGIVHRLYAAEIGKNLIEKLLDHLMMLIHVMGKVVRKYLETHFVPLLCKFLDAHLQPCLDIIESLR